MFDILGLDDIEGAKLIVSKTVYDEEKLIYDPSSEPGKIVNLISAMMP